MKAPLMAVAVHFVFLSFAFPTPGDGQEKTDGPLLKYKAQPQALLYELNIASQSRSIARTGVSGVWRNTQTQMDDLELSVEEVPGGELVGRYRFGDVQVWQEASGSKGWNRTRYRDTTYQILGTGEVGEMGGRVKSSSGDDIFKRQWEIPHVLPEGPVEVGTTWSVERSINMPHTHFTEIETRYEVVEILDEDVWVEYSGHLFERLSGRRNGFATEGDFSGRFGFRPSLGAVVGIEWDYEYKTGHIDRPWEFTEFVEDGSIVLKGLADELPVHEAQRLVEDTKDNKRALKIGLVIGGIVIALAAGLGFIG